MNFKIGDKVVCVNVSKIKGCLPPPLVLHKEYDLLDIKYCEGCGVVGLFVGLHCTKGNTVTCICGNNEQGNGGLYHPSFRFVKLDTIEDAITELLKETKIEHETNY